MGIRVTQTELAKSCWCGYTHYHSIGEIIKGKRPRNPSLLQSIAKVFTEVLGREITIDDLIEKEREENSLPTGRH